MCLWCRWASPDTKNARPCPNKPWDFPVQTKLKMTCKYTQHCCIMLYYYTDLHCGRNPAPVDKLIITCVISLFFRVSTCFNHPFGGAGFRNHPLYVVFRCVFFSTSWRRSQSFNAVRFFIQTYFLVNISMFIGRSLLPGKSRCLSRNSTHFSERNQT